MISADSDWNKPIHFTYLHKAKPMRRFLALILVFSVWLGISLTNAAPALAEFSFNTLTPCGQSSAYKERLASEVSGYQSRLSNFTPGTAQANYLQGKIAATEARFDKYANSSLLCGEDGLPHLITDGRFDHAGEFLIPAVIFLYITGWIGWVGRGYLRSIMAESYATALQKEIVLDLPKAFAFSLTGFAWPLLAFQEFVTGKLVAPENEVPVSPR